MLNKIDFAVIIEVENANPNGDPIANNYPRQNHNGFGEISDVCIKRKLRNRFMDMDLPIFVQTNGTEVDAFRSLKERFDNHVKQYKLTEKTSADDLAIVYQDVCDTWLDVRMFGQVFAFKSSKISMGVRGAVTIQPVLSTHPVDIIHTQITKSVNGEQTSGKASDTMGAKQRVAYGVYVLKGSISPILAQKTGMTKEDVQHLQDALRTLFENDASSARPEGSMRVQKVCWWEHDTPYGVQSSYRTHSSLHLTSAVAEPTAFDDFDMYVDPINGVTYTELDGF